MEHEEKILVSEECIKKLKIGLKTIKINVKDNNLKKEAANLLAMLENEINDDNLSLKEKIMEKMRETKNSNPDMNANLYILYRNLVSGRISEEQAFELYNMYVKIGPYDRTIE